MSPLCLLHPFTMVTIMGLSVSRNTARARARVPRLVDGSTDGRTDGWVRACHGFQVIESKHARQGRFRKRGGCSPSELAACFTSRQAATLQSSGRSKVQYMPKNLRRLQRCEACKDPGQMKYGHPPALASRARCNLAAISAPFTLTTAFGHRADHVGIFCALVPSLSIPQ